MDLSLVPMDELVKELESRCESFIMAYTVRDPQERASDWFYYGRGVRSKAVQLASDLNNDVLNNWNGELRVLHKLSEDYDG